MAFDKVIPPGGEGRIRLKVKTKGYHGRLSKGARVYTDDPNKAFFTLRINAFVKVPIHISSKFVYLSGISGQSLTRHVLIEAREERPLELTPVTFTLKDKVNFSIQETIPGRKFQLVFATAPGVVGSYNGFLKLKTNYPHKPEIYIRIRLKIKPIKSPMPKPSPPVVSPGIKDNK